MLGKIIFLLYLFSFLVFPSFCAESEPPRIRRQTFCFLRGSGICLPVEPRRECRGEACGKIGCPGRGTCLCSETGDWYCSGPRIGRQADGID
ncbi:unnamed protein product, partial [Mesorhabditis spiculigera]